MQSNLSKELTFPKSNRLSTQCLNVRFSFISGSLNVVFFGCLGRKKEHFGPWVDKLTFYRWDHMYQGHLGTAWLAPNQSNINQFQQCRQYFIHLCLSTNFNFNTINDFYLERLLFSPIPKDGRYKEVWLYIYRSETGI
jgi:hypothetical protein